MHQPEPIKIIAVDPKRPPAIRKAPYIELFFELSEAVPAAWREDFNASLNKHMSRPKINAEDGLFIETWVRKPADIAEHLELLRTTVAQCNERAIVRARELFAAGQADDSSKAVGGEQKVLNDAVAALVFDD